MWYFIAKWFHYNTVVYTQFMSLDDLTKWWEEECENNFDAWGLEIYDRTGCRIFTPIAKSTEKTIELYKKMNARYLDLS